MTYESAVLSSTPALFLKLDETSGSTAVDSSGNNFSASHIGTFALGQPSLLADGTGKSVLYSGSGYTDVSPASNLNSGNVTVNMRIKTNSGSLSGTQVLASRWRNSSLGLLWLFTLEAGKVRATVQLSGVNYVAEAPTALTAGQTCTVAMSFDGTAVRVFVDGTQVASTAASGSIASMTTAFEIARAAAAVYGNVQIDGFAYWTRALSASTLANLHTEATSAPPGGALAVTLPKPIVTLTGTVQPPVVRSGFGMMLASVCPVSVIPPTSDKPTEPLHVTTPTVPAPTLVDGRPT